MSEIDKKHNRDHPHKYELLYRIISFYQFFTFVVGVIELTVY